MGFLYIPPVACGQGVLEPIRNDTGLNGQLKIKVLPPVNKLLCIDPDLLQQVLKHSGKNRHVYFNFGFDLETCRSIILLKHLEMLNESFFDSYPLKRNASKGPARSSLLLP